MVQIPPGSVPWTMDGTGLNRVGVTKNGFSDSAGPGRQKLADISAVDHSIAVQVDCGIVGPEVEQENPEIGAIDLTVIVEVGVGIGGFGDRPGV